MELAPVYMKYQNVRGSDAIKANHTHLPKHETDPHPEEMACLPPLSWAEELQQQNIIHFKNISSLFAIQLLFMFTLMYIIRLCPLLVTLSFASSTHITKSCICVSLSANSGLPLKFYFPFPRLSSISMIAIQIQPQVKKSIGYTAFRIEFSILKPYKSQMLLSFLSRQEI